MRARAISRRSPVLRRLAIAGLAVALAGGLLTGATGCGGSDDGTLATQNQVSASPTPAITTTPLLSPATTPGAAVTAIEMLARDNSFEPAAFRIPAGQEITLTLRNEGAALHDWQLLNVRDSSGAAIKTVLLQAGQSATLRFTVSTPGEYAYYCEVHPVDMRGRLTVQ